jgi:ABC-type transport system substrate-binding protein
MKPRFVSLVPGLLVALALTLVTKPTPGFAQATKTDRLVFASAGFSESNRFWTVARPDHLQYDPFLETLLEVDPKSGKYTPRLAEKWYPSADYKEWTFILRKGVAFHFGFGQFTAKDVVHSHSLMMRQEATATLAGFWRQVEEVKAVNDHQVVFREESTRLAMLLSGEAHIADLPRELQKDAIKRGMKIYSSSFPVDWMTIYLGGLYFMPGDPAFKAEVPWTNKKVRQAMNIAVNRKELLNTVFAGKGTYTYVTGWLPQSEGWNPEWQRRFDGMYGYNPTKAKALLKEAGYGPGQLKVKILAFTEPGESEGPQVAEALGIYFKDVGIESEIEVLDWAKVREGFRKKTIGCCIWPNIISWRPSEESIRTFNYSKGPNHHFENEFIDKTYLAWAQSVKPEERQRHARAIADHLFEEFADIPLFWFANEVVANPKVVGDWVYPGLAAGRSTHFHLVKPAK